MTRKKAAKKAATKGPPKKKPTDLFPSNDPVAVIDAVLQKLELQAARGQVPSLRLETFKSSLDELRLRAWGLLMATNADDPHGFQERFRIARGKDMCLALCRDLREGKLSGHHPDLRELKAAAHDLAAAVDNARVQTS
jgi:hypothetical protein